MTTGGEAQNDTPFSSVKERIPSRLEVEEIPNLKRQRAKIKMTTQNAKTPERGGRSFALLRTKEGISSHLEGFNAKCQSSNAKRSSKSQ